MKKKPTSAETQRERIIAYKQVFGGPAGTLVLQDLINRFHILAPLPDQTELAVSKVQKYEGQRSVVLHILTQCKVDIEAFDRLLKGEDLHDPTE